MKLEVFQKEINFKVLQQMKQLVKNQNIDSSSFIPLFNCIPEQEPFADFSYPGEVLERYEDRYGSDITIIRALALALLECKLDTDMFIGNQYIQFIHKIRRMGKSDLYLMGTLYHLTTKEKEKEDIFHILLSYPFQFSHEIIFALYILQKEEAAWEALSLQLSILLGEKRSLTWYGNLQLLAWLIQRFHAKKLSKGLELLKALFSLPFKHIKIESPVWKQLQKHGYSKYEIIYINLQIPNLLKFDKVLKSNSITMERMAVEACEVILNAEQVENSHLYDLCDTLFHKYKYFEIKLKGNNGIVETLDYQNQICVQNEKSFLFLWKHKKNFSNIPDNFFYINIMEPKWDSLAKQLMLDEYKTIFELSFIYMYQQQVHDFSIKHWLDKYKALVGENYNETFWKKNHTNSFVIFTILIKEKWLDLQSLLKQYHTDVKNMSEKERHDKWSTMANHIYEKTKMLSSNEDYLFWENFIAAYGIDDLEKFFNKKTAFFEALTTKQNTYYYNRTPNYRLNITRDFLSKEEQFTLLCQLENYIFINMTEDYYNFLILILDNEEIRNLFPEQCKDLFFMLDSYDKDYIKIHHLRKYFYTKEELEEYSRIKENEKKKLDEKRIEERSKELKHDLVISLSNAQNRIDEIAKFLEKNYIKEDLAPTICADYLLAELEEKKEKVSHQTIYIIIKNLLYGFKYKNVKWSTLQTIIEKLEVQKDECKKTY